VTWNRAWRAVVVAVALLVLTLFAAANFVLVDVRLLGADVRLRLGWVAVVPSLVAFGLGLLYARLRD
jgi:uncharacterized integral membrane protein